MTRIKVVVIGLFAAYWIVVVVLLLAARPTVDLVLDQQVKVSGDHGPAEVAAMVALTALLLLLSIGVVRNWRWIFWLILAAYLAGILRLPAAALELTGRLPTQLPAWYVVLTAVVGVIQFGIALAMLLGYRRAGVWGDF